MGNKMGPRSVYALTNLFIYSSVYLKLFFVAVQHQMERIKPPRHPPGCRRQTASNFHILSFAFPRKELG